MRLFELENNDTSLLDVLRKINKPEIIKHFNKYRIYRGIENEERDYYTQKSGNRFNYKIRKSSILSHHREIAKTGAKLLSNLPSWKNYPSREHSHICSTSSSFAGSYGENYLVFPLSNTNIGNCPDKDFLYCFYIKEIGVPYKWYVLLKILKDNDIIDDMGNVKNLEERTTNSNINKLFYGKNAKKVLDKKLSPDENGFWLLSPLEYHGGNGGDGNEIWFEGEALFISLEYLKNGGQPQLDKYLYENK